MCSAILEAMVAAQLLDERHADAARARLLYEACAAGRCAGLMAQLGHALVLVGQRLEGVRYAPVAAAPAMRWEGGR